MPTTISIIIATRNCVDALDGCLRSVFSQTFRDFEVLIQDGRSTDGTQIAASRFRDPRLALTSVIDSGIYDAWNRALSRASGEWIMFLGADDRFATPTVLQRRVDALSSIPDEVEIVCGKVALVNKDGQVTRVVGSRWNWTTLRRYQNVAHIGLMQRRRLFERLGMFNTSYRIAGDYEFLLRAGESTKALFLDEVEIFAGEDGISQTRYVLALSETFRAQLGSGALSPAFAILCGLVALGKALVRDLRRRWRFLG